MVAVEAASYGCDIVVTEIGGPKEYYGSRAFVVNPYDVDEIGKAVVAALAEKEYQPQLMKKINEKYSLPRCVAQLAEEYSK